MRALLIKDHYYSATPVTEVLNKQFEHLDVTLLSGVPLTSLEASTSMPSTTASRSALAWSGCRPSRPNHIDVNAKSKGFPHTSMTLLEEPLTVLDERQLIDAVKPILDHIAKHDVVLSGGHLTSRRSLRSSRKPRSAASPACWSTTLPS